MIVVIRQPNVIFSARVQCRERIMKNVALLANWNVGISFPSNYNLINNSPVDTIHGRQCMASCYFLLKQFEDVLIYFNSIKSYFYNDDAFNFNYAQAKAAVGNYKEAEEVSFCRSDIKVNK